MTKARILVVEDENIVVLELQSRLKSLGYTVLAVASSGEKAIQKTAELRPDLVLMDIKLKGKMDGVEAAEQIRARFGIPVIYLTAYADTATLQRAKITEPFGYVLKPFGERELSATIEMALYRHKLEQRLRESERWLSATLGSIGEAVIATDDKGGVRFINPVAEALTGWSQEEALGQDLSQVFHIVEEETRTVAENPAVEALQEGVVVGLREHTILISRDGTEMPIDANAAPIRDDKGNITGVVLVFRDITERVRAEEELRQSAKMASVGRLAAGVAHELNNPLGAMMQSAQMLQLALDTQRPHTRERLQNYGVDPEGLERYLQARGLTEYLDGIRTTGGRAAKIVADLLSFSRKASSDVAPHDLNNLVEQTLDLAATDYDLKKKYDFRDIEIVYELASDLPPVTCDGQQIQQVVLNLVRNAAQAMADSKWRIAKEAKRLNAKAAEWHPRLTLRTSLQREEIRDPQSAIPLRSASGRVRNRVQLEVEDNGPGLPEAMRTRLFEPFFTTRDVREGMGLGLWLCWSIVVEQHKGRIWAEPGKDGGSRFVVELPVV